MGEYLVRIVAQALRAEARLGDWPIASRTWQARATTNPRFMKIKEWLSVWLKTELVMTKLMSEIMTGIRMMNSSLFGGATNEYFPEFQIAIKIIP
jgi:hypothetical protein